MRERASLVAYVLVLAVGVWTPAGAAADTRLIAAVRAGDEKAVRALLARKGVNVNEPAPDGTTAQAKY